MGGLLLFLMVVNDDGGAVAGSERDGVGDGGAGGAPVRAAVRFLAPAAAWVLSARHFLRADLRHAFLCTVESQMAAAGDALKGPVAGELRKRLSGAPADLTERLVSKARTPAPDCDRWRAIRDALHDERSVLGRAFERAKQTFAGERALSKLEFAKGASRSFDAYREAHPEVRAKGATPHLDPEYSRLQRDARLGVVLTREAREALAEATAKQVPWHKKLSTVGVQMTSKQRLTCFAVTLTVAIGAFGVTRKARGGHPRAHLAAIADSARGGESALAARQQRASEL